MIAIQDLALSKIQVSLDKWGPLSDASIESEVKGMADTVVERLRGHSRKLSLVTRVSEVLWII